MRHMTLKKRANFYGDRPMLSAITLQKVCKNIYISMINYLKVQKVIFFLSEAHVSWLDILFVISS